MNVLACGRLFIKVPTLSQTALTLNGDRPRPLPPTSRVNNNNKSSFFIQMSHLNAARPETKPGTFILCAVAQVPSPHRLNPSSAKTLVHLLTTPLYSGHPLLIAVIPQPPTKPAMAGFTAAVQGNGLAKLYRALKEFELDPSRLADARRRFSHSPPSYRSYPSGTTTRTTSLNPPSEQQRIYEERMSQLMSERNASLPRVQFDDQRDEETKRLWFSNPETNWMPQIPFGGPFNAMVYEKIKKGWVDQGIWNNTWSEMVDGLWKHEEPLELESESETDSEAEPLTPPFYFGMSPDQRQPRPRRPKSDEEKRKIADRRAVRERDREASRPYHQFIFQISKERKRIEHESRSADGSSNTDINTRAYENVKNTWWKRGIWNRKWGVLPGMSWKHEEPLQEVTDDMPIMRKGEFDIARDEPVEAPPKRFFEPLYPVEPNHPRESEIANASQHESSANGNWHGFENGNAEYTSATKRGGPQQRRYIFKRGSVDAVQICFGTNEAESLPLPVSERGSVDAVQICFGTSEAEPLPLPVCKTPRRSERLRRQSSRVPKDPIRPASTASSKRTIQPTTERNGGKKAMVRGFAKPKGVSKKKRAKTTRGKVTNK